MERRPASSSGSWHPESERISRREVTIEIAAKTAMTNPSAIAAVARSKVTGIPAAILGAASHIKAKSISGYPAALDVPRLAQVSIRLMITVEKSERTA